MPVGPNAVRLLLVEDDLDLRDSYVDLLTSEGFRVVAVATAEEGVTELERGGFDALITDHDLPGKTGAWLLAEALQRSLLPEGHRLLVTAHPTPQSVPGVAVFRKPVDLEAFLAHLRAPALRRS